MSQNGGTTHTSIYTTASSPATEQTASLKTNDDHRHYNLWLTYLRGVLDKETEAGNERGMTVYSEAIDDGVARLKEIERLEAENRDWRERYGVFTEDAQSDK
jgi:hypothetical protein